MIQIMIPTKEEYEAALLIVKAYEEEQNILLEIRKEEFLIELKEYLQKNTPFTDVYLDERFNNSFSITPENDDWEEAYDGEYDKEIEIIAKKHNIEASFVYWLYPK